MKNSNLIVQSLWIGDHLSPMEILSVQSYLHNGHEFHLYCYNKIAYVPKGVKIMDANEIVSEKKIFLDSRNGVAAFSDYFRYCLLFKRGGWWVDLDTVCMHHFNFANDYCFATERINSSAGNVIATAYIKSPPNAEYLAECIKIIEKKRNGNIRWGVFGPFFLARVLEGYHAADFIELPDVFCPVAWYEVDELVLGIETQRNFINAKAIHLWNERWRVEKKDKYDKFHPDSLYEQLKKKYGVKNAGG